MLVYTAQEDVNKSIEDYVSGKYGKEQTNAYLFNLQAEKYKVG